MFKCDGPEDMKRPEWAFRQLFRAHRLATDCLLDSRGLREVGQPLLLQILLFRRASGASCTQKELAEIMQISPSTLTVSIKSLEKRGYVRKTSDETDMRRNLIEITDKGAAAANECTRCFTEIDAAMYSGFSESEREQIASLLLRMTENLNALAARCADNRKGSDAEC